MKKISKLRMCTTLIGFCHLIPNLFGAAAADALALPELPVVAQNTDVHTISRTYCNALWRALDAPRLLSYESATSDEFRTLFDRSVSELTTVITRISKEEPVAIGDRLTGADINLAELDADTLSAGTYFDKSLLANLQLGLTSLKVLGKHKGASDFDAETSAHVNEVFVYTWNKVKENPEARLMAFLIGLADAAPTCIQGYTVRLLCAVHPPKQKK
jgi:hypothetical protein